MTDERPYWNAYVESLGGTPLAVSKKLGIPYSTVAGICNGSRGIGRGLARRMALADPMLDASRLVWVRPISGLSGMSMGIPEQADAA